jgi:gliding motility-associated-like protein
MLIISAQKHAFAIIKQPKLGIHFIENKGQWPSEVLFRADIPIGDLFIEKNTLTYLFVDKEAIHEAQHKNSKSKIHYHAVKLRFLNASSKPNIVKEEQFPTYFNYFVGPKSNWASQVHAYQKITLKNLYPNIDLELISQGESIKMNFQCHPGSNPNNIKIKYDGANDIQIKNGEFITKTDLGEIKEQAPFSFQGMESNSIQTSYQLNKKVLSYNLANYSKNQVLTIDPNIVFGTYIGSAADNFGFSATFDNNGNAYGAGTVYASNFPATAGAYDLTYAGGQNIPGESARDAFISKFSPDGSSLIYATFLGGASNEQPHSMTVNSLGELVIYGTTTSNTFPTTSNSYDTTLNGNHDIFICKLSNNGSTLIASTFVGGVFDDGINGNITYPYANQTILLPYNYADNYRGEVICDASGNIYVATSTKSKNTDNLPIINPAQATYGGGWQDGFLFKMNSNLNTMLSSTYIGGSGDDAAYSLCLDNLNNLYVSGGTTSTDIAGLQNSPKGAIDGFVAKFNASNLSRLNLVYYGTVGNDQCQFVQVDPQNFPFVMGQTNGNITPTTGAYSQTNGKHFVSKLSKDLSTILLTGIFGPSMTEPGLSPSAFMVDNCGKIYISGWGGQTNYNYHAGLSDTYNLPVSPNAFQNTTDGSDFYLGVFSPNMASLLYGTYIGGGSSAEHVDGGTSHFDKSGIIYQSVCAGCGGFSDFPTTVTAHSRTNPGKRPGNANIGGCNLAMFKFDLRTYLAAPVFKDTILNIEAGDELNFKIIATDSNGDRMTFFASSPIFASHINRAQLTDTLDIPGRYEVNLKWTSNCNYANRDTIVIDVEFNDNACPNPNITKGKIKIVVQSFPIPAPFPSCLRALSDNSVELNWNPPAPDTYLNKYRILRKTGFDNPIVLYDSILAGPPDLYKDQAAINHLNTNYCYQLISLNNCLIPGDTSRTICSIIKDDTLTDLGFSNIENEFYKMNAFDTLTISKVFYDTDPKDSVFLQLQTSINQGPKFMYRAENNSSFGLFWARYISDCSDVGDTVEIEIVLYDNQCPAPRRKTKRIKIYIAPFPPAPPTSLGCPRRYNNDTIEIRWKALQANQFTQKLYVLESIDGAGFNPVFETSNLSTTSLIYTKKFDFNSNYCYKVVSSDVCNIYNDSSIEVCTKDANKTPPAIGIHTVSVVNDKSIEVKWQSVNKDSFWRYELYKKTGRIGSDYQLIHLASNANDTEFIDSEVSVDDFSYCYKIFNTNDCGTLSFPSKDACSIVLQGIVYPFEYHQLYWLPYTYFKEGLNRYELLKTEPGIYTEKLHETTFDKTVESTDKNLNPDNGLYQYKVVAYDNHVNPPYSSVSNTVDLVEPPVLNVPNAFTPNGDLLNDELKTVHIFVKDYHLKIFNRWGELIWESKNKNEGFIGDNKSIELANDVYFYIVDYSGWDGSSYSKKGNITILR